MEPINYSRDVLSPVQGFLQGIKFGEGILTDRQGREATALGMDETRQMMGLRGSEEARQAEGFAAQQAEAARQQAAANAMQESLGALRQKAMDGTLSAEDINQFGIANASTFGDLKEIYEAQAQPKKDADRQTTMQIASGLLRGNTDAALSIIDERIAAAENSGLADEANKFKAIRAQIEMDPLGYATGSLASAVALGAIDGTTMKTILDASGQGADTTGTFRALQERAKAGGLVEGTPEYSKFMLEGGKTDSGVNITNITGAAETEFQKAVGKDAATLFSGLANAGASASRNINELDTLSKILEGVSTGAGASAKAFLGSIGINTEGLSEIQAAEAIINRLIPAQRPPGSGTISDVDVAMFKRSLPSLINQPGGNEIIIETIRSINEYDIAASIIAGSVIDGDMTQAEGREALRNIPNPLSGFRAPSGDAPAPPAQGGVRTFNPETGELE